MFNGLKKMLQRTIFLTICFLSILFSIVSVSFTSIVAYRDYISKSHQLTRQYAASLSLNLNTISETASLFIHKSHLAALLDNPKYSYEIINILNQIKNPNLNILGITLVTGKNSIYFTDSGYDSTFLQAIFGEDYLTVLQNTVTFPHCILRSDFNTHMQFALPLKHLLLYAIPIFNEDNIRGHLLITCSMENLFQSLNFSENLFTEGANIFLYTGENSVSIYTGTPKVFLSAMGDLQQSAYEQTTSNGHISFCRIGNFNLGFCVYTPYTTILKHNQIFAALVLISIAVFLFVCTIALHRLIQGIITPLTNLCAELNNYIIHKKSEE